MNVMPPPGPRILAATLVLLLHFCCTLASARGYKNVTLQIPMRDGVTLNTLLYLPDDISPTDRIGTIGRRTPYNAITLESVGTSIATMGWACVLQDERGRYASGGLYTMLGSAANDTFDTIAFCSNQSWSNGLVAWTGFSADAVTSYLSPLSTPGPPHPAMASQFNDCGTARLHEFEYQGGAYRTELISGWLNSTGEAPFIPIVEAHEGWSDFWSSTTQSFESRWSLVNYPILHLAGWYDVFSSVQIADFFAISAGGGPRAANHQFLVVEPGGHCGGGAVPWPNATWGRALANDYQVTLFQQTIGPPLGMSELSAGAEAGVESSLRADDAARTRDGRGGDDASAAADTVAKTAAAAAAAAATAGESDAAVATEIDAAAVVRSIRARRSSAAAASANASTVIWYVLGPSDGSMGNIWAGGTELDFTPSLLTVLFLRGDGSLTLEHPGASERVSTWIADPVNPIPTLGGNVQNIRPCGPQDQTPVERDFVASIVLFQTEVLPTTLLVHGLVTASLFIASDAPDTDVNVKVTDVYPSGESMLVADGVSRLRWRNGPFSTSPAPPLVPGHVIQVEVDVAWISMLFNPGHRLRVAISSSNSPRFSVNPNTGASLNSSAPGVLAHNSVISNSTHPSSLRLPSLPLERLLQLRL